MFPHSTFFSIPVTHNPCANCTFIWFALWQCHWPSWCQSWPVKGILHKTGANMTTSHAVSHLSMVLYPMKSRVRVLGSAQESVCPSQLPSLVVSSSVPQESEHARHPARLLNITYANLSLQAPKTFSVCLSSLTTSEQLLYRGGSRY